MGPVHEPAKLVPFVHATNLDAIAHTERHALGKIEVVGDQQCPAIADVDNETLVPIAIIVIT